MAPACCTEAVSAGRCSHMALALTVFLRQASGNYDLVRRIRRGVECEGRPGVAALWEVTSG
jgi:hypothetical protein